MTPAEIFSGVIIAIIAASLIGIATIAYKFITNKILSKKLTPQEKQEMKEEFKIASNYYEKAEYKEAFRWFRKCANLGHAEAQYFLATMYKEKKGVMQNYKEALKWAGKSAEQGDAEGQYLYGYMHYKGLGTAKNLIKGYMWFNLSSKSGKTHVGNPKSIMAGQMNAEEIAEAERLVAEWQEEFEKRQQ